MNKKGNVMKSSWVVKPVCVAIWMMGHVGAVSAAEVAVSKDVVHNAIAQNDDKTLPTVDVTADAPAEMSDVPDAQQPVGRKDLDPDSPTNPYRVPVSNRAGIQTFTPEDIRNLHPRDIFDLLDKATGITVTYQGRKNPYFVKQRGGGSFTYIIDGAILPTVTQRILQRIPLTAIEEFQVVRDATALTIAPLINIGATGGGDGLNTGFIIIRTRQPKQDEISIVVSGEKAVNQPSANQESLFAGKHLGGNGKDEVGGYVSGLASSLDRPSKDDWFDGQKGKGGMFGAGLGNDRFSVNLMYYDETGRFEMQRGINPKTGALDNSRWFYDPIDTKVWSLSSSLEWNADQTTLASLFSTRYGQKETTGTFTTALPAPANYWERTSGYSLRHNARFGNTYINLGTQSTRSWAEGTSSGFGSLNQRWDSTVTGYGATIEQRLLDEKLFLDAGYRRDEKHVDTTDTSVRMRNIDLPPAQAVSIGGRWLFAPGYALNGRYFDGDQGSSGGDFSLQPLPGKKLDAETQKRWELGIEGSLSSIIKATATWFDVNVKNQKTQTTTAYTNAGSQFYYYTQADSQRSGYELLVQGNFALNSSYKASWTHLVRNQLTGTTGLAANQINANNLYDLSVTHGFGDYTANVSWKRVDEYYGSNSGTAPAVKIGGYDRFDANLMRDFRWNGVLFGATLYGRNLGNSHYVTQQGPTGLYPDRGRTLGIELRTDF